MPFGQKDARCAWLDRLIILLRQECSQTNQRSAPSQPPATVIKQNGDYPAPLFYLKQTNPNEKRENKSLVPSAFAPTGARLIHGRKMDQRQ